MILVSLIVGNPAIAGNILGIDPIDSVELVSIIMGLLVFTYFAITISINSHRRKKEIEAEIVEWKRGEEERKRRLDERLAELES